MSGKKFSLKPSSSTGGLPKYGKQGQSSGGNALKSDHKIARDGRGPLKGIANARHQSIKPSSSSGTIGSGQPLKTNSGGKEQQGSDNPIRRTTKRSKPNN